MYEREEGVAMKQQDALNMMLRSLRLPTMVEEQDSVSKTAEKEGWNYQKYLYALCELEVNERSRRRIERILKKSVNGANENWES